MRHQLALIPFSFKPTSVAINMSLPLTYLDPPQRLYATEEIDETIQLAASDFHQDRYDDCIQKCQGLLTHFRDIPFYFQLSIHTLLGSAYQDSASVQVSEVESRRSKKQTKQRQTDREKGRVLNLVFSRSARTIPPKPYSAK
jgi:hypothetical protein